MHRHLREIATTCVFSLSALCVNAQSAPASPDKPWNNPAAEQSLNKQLSALPDTKYTLDPSKAYTLAELIDLAEQHNPETRVAWQQAKARASALGIARGALFPTLAAVAVGNTTRTQILFNSAFVRQTYGAFEPELHVEYLIFDFGGRSGAIDAAKANLLASNLTFNNTHLKIIFQVTSAYYRLLNAMGQMDAAEASLKNAQAVEEDAQDRLDHGLATKPDVLEATASRAQAEYDLQTVTGAQEIAHGDLATAMGLPPQTIFHVQDVNELKMPSELAESIDTAIDRAFEQRPDLKAQLAQLRAANAAIKQAKSRYYPSLLFNGNGGLTHEYGQQGQLPSAYARSEIWDVSLGLQWTLFDGGRREHEIAQAKAERSATLAEINSLRDQISDEVWTAYSNVKTAERQQLAAAALLVASDQSYTSARESYGYGVRNLLDVVAAQKALAQARTEDVTARTQLLLQVADLAFRTGDLLATPPAKTGP
ncbi:TolC family protein [Alloacidobacterium dinghuense]|uniref:TolC family protein n=1 Tax=Alloacidobacterium dinghuense TaxID=2763107 RepID=A0A7G8BCV5_9BACT|nr:TolC family protein [Alloacidobacterium dinghuense]QNI30375.1 TolC family protein [Alloacidobacterium dinghuense]